MNAEASAPRRLQWLTLFLLALVVTALLTAALLRARSASPEFNGTVYDPPQPAADFTLTDHTGAQLRLSDLRGTPVLLFFGYTHCPDVCPLTLATLRRSLEAVDAGPEDVRVLLVSVDPERDTPEVLARYVARFGPWVSGLTGTADTLSRVRAAYGVHAEPGGGSGGHAEMMHTSAVFGIDSRGLIRVLLRPESASDELESDVAALLEL